MNTVLVRVTVTVIVITVSGPEDEVVIGFNVIGPVAADADEGMAVVVVRSDVNTIGITTASVTVASV